MDYFCSSFKNTFVLILDGGQATGHEAEQRSGHQKHSLSLTVYIDESECLWVLDVCYDTLSNTRISKHENDKLQMFFDMQFSAQADGFFSLSEAFRFISGHRCTVQM